MPFASDIWGYCFITEMELLSQKNLATEERELIRRLLGSCIRFGHSQEVTDMTIELRKQYGLKLPDAIIAATSRAAGVPLLMADKHFGKIKEIDCILLQM